MDSIEKLPPSQSPRNNIVNLTWEAYIVRYLFVHTHRGWEREGRRGRLEILLQNGDRNLEVICNKTKPKYM